MLVSQLFERVLVKPAIENLEKYKDDPTIYIQYSNILKLGINPNYEYRFTPLGIYSYPLKLSWNNIIKGGTFASNRDYIHVFRLVYPHNILFASAYGYQNFYRDLKIIRATYEHLLKTGRIIEDDNNYNHRPIFDHLLSDYESDDGTDKQSLLEPLLFLISRLGKIESRKRPAAFMNAIMRQMGHEGMVDDFGFQISGDIQYQAAFFSIAPISPIETITNKGPLTSEREIKLKRTRKTLSWKDLVELDDIIGAIYKYREEYGVPIDLAREKIRQYKEAVKVDNRELEDA